MDNLQRVVDVSFHNVPLEATCSHCADGGKVVQRREVVVAPKLICIVINRNQMLDGRVVKNIMAVSVPSRLKLIMANEKSVSYVNPCSIQHDSDDKSGHYYVFTSIGGRPTMIDDSVGYD